MSKKIMKRSLALGALMAFVITGSAWAADTSYNRTNEAGITLNDGNDVINSLFDGCRATKGGAIYFSGGERSVKNSTFVNNVATGSGTDPKGGAINLKAAVVNLEGNKFINNTCEYKGGVIELQPNSTLSLTGNNEFIGNSSRWCGAIAINKATVEFIDYLDKDGKLVKGYTLFKNNISDDKNDSNYSQGGGAILVEGNSSGKLNFNSDVDFVNNYSKHNGGAISNYGIINFVKGTVNFIGNKADVNSFETTNVDGVKGFKVSDDVGRLNDIYNIGTINVYEDSIVNLDGGIDGKGTINIVGGILNGRLLDCKYGVGYEANSVLFDTGSEKNSTWNLQGDSVVKSIVVKGDATINGAVTVEKDVDGDGRSILGLNKDISSASSFAIKHNAGDLEIHNIVLEEIKKSSTDDYCGVVLFSVADIEITNSVVAKNRYEDGSGIGSGIVFGSNNAMGIIGSEFDNNYASDCAGALWHQLGKLTVSDSSFNGNEAGNSGGALYLCQTELELNGEVTFTNNKAGAKGGAIYIEDSIVRFNGNTTFTGNTANGEANDIYNAGIININQGATVKLDGGITGNGTTNINGGTLELNGGVTNIKNLGGEGGSIIFSNANADFVVTENTNETLKFMATGKVNEAIGGDANELISNVDWAKDTTMILEAGDIIGEVTAVLVENEKTGCLMVKSKTEKANPANEALSNAGIGMKLHNRAHMNDMNKRLGELRDANGDLGVWTRMVRGESEYKNVKAQYNQYQLGYDEKLSVDKRWTVGAAVTFSEGDASYGYGSTEDKSTAFAIYGSKLNNDGTFIDLIARYAHLESDVDDQAGKGDMSANSMSVSAEFGKRIQQGKGLWIEPQVELTYGTLDSAELQLDRKTVQIGDIDSLIGRVGFRIGQDIEKGNVYARASYLYDFDGETKTTFSNATATRDFKDDLGGGWWEVGVGANINLSKATYVYADVEKTFGGEVDTNWQWNLGVRYSF